MEINTLPPLAGGVEAFSRASQGIEQNAQNIVAQTTETAEASAPSLEESLVNLNENRNYSLAGVKLIEAEDNMVGLLLDVDA